MQITLDGKIKCLSKGTALQVGRFIGLVCANNQFIVICLMSLLVIDTVKIWGLNTSSLCISVVAGTTAIG